MSISPLSGQEQLRASRAVAAFRGTNASAASSAPTRQPDVVTISDDARSLAGAHKAAAEVPEVRADRIAQIKAGIANGTYHVDSYTLARTLVKRAIEA
jgi:flagellar biosynthesis anti-sigma factor FlgM